jgi:hypothetical protein
MLPCKFQEREAYGTLRAFTKLTARWVERLADALTMRRVGRRGIIFDKSTLPNSHMSCHRELHASSLATAKTIAHLVDSGQIGAGGR